jgi:hypothetical protein
MNQRSDALPVILDYFNSPDAFEWDDSYSRLVKLSLRLSLDLLVRVPTVIKHIVTMSLSSSLDHLSVLTDYLREGRLCVSDGQRRLSEARRLVPHSIDDEVMNALFLERPLAFSRGIYADSLSNVREIPSVFHSILIHGYQFALSFQSSELEAVLTKELEYFCRRSDVGISDRLLIVDMLFNRYRTEVELGLIEKAGKALDEAGFYLNSQAASLELREHLEVQRALYAAIKKDRVATAEQFEKLASFYAGAPIDPSIPLPSVWDLGLMAALVVPVGEKSRSCLVWKMLKSSRKSSLSEFARAAEEAKDPQGICRGFQSFLREYARLFKIPGMYGALAQFAAIRIVQAIASQREAVGIEELASILPWLAGPQLHTAIFRATQAALVRARIDMKGGCVRFVR